MKPSSMRRSANEIAKPKPPDSILVHHGGWHFSWIGDDESVKNKLYERDIVLQSETEMTYGN